MKRSLSISDFLDAFVIFFSIWTIYCHLAVLSGSTLVTLTALAPLPMVLSLFLWVLRHSPHEARTPTASWTSEPSHRGPSFRRSRLFMLTIAIIITGGYAWSDNYLLFWILACGFLACSLFFWQPKDDEQQVHGLSVPSKPCRCVARAALALLICTAVAITLIARRADKDDSYYLNVVVNALDHPHHELMLHHDSMYGEQNLPSFNGPYRVHAYELMVAVLSHVLGVPAGFFYYLLFPSLFAALVIIANYLAMQQFAGRYAVWGVWLVLVVLLTWGDVHRSFGNFSFVRLYQGKGVLVSVLVPSIVYYGSVYTRRRTRRTGMLLTACMTAAVGFSATSLVVAPVTAGIVLLGESSVGHHRLRVTGFGFFAVPAVAFLGLVIMALTRHAGYGLNPRRYTSFSPATIITTTRDSLHIVMGSGLRCYASLFSLLAASVAAFPSRQRRSIAAISLVTMVVIFNPLIPFLTSTLNHTLNWRIFWAAPIPLFVGLASIGFFPAGFQFGRLHAGMIMYPVLALAFALAGGTTTLSHQNYVTLGAPSYKTDYNYRIAKQIAASTNTGDLVLAPWGVSVWLPTFRHHPRLIGIRPMHLGIIKRALGKTEARIRREMMDFVSGTPGSRQWLSLVIQEIRRRPVTLVVFSKTIPRRLDLEAALKKMGYLEWDVAEFRFWKRPLEVSTHHHS